MCAERMSLSGSENQEARNVIVKHLRYLRGIEGQSGGEGHQSERVRNIEPTANNERVPTGYAFA